MLLNLLSLFALVTTQTVAHLQGTLPHTLAGKHAQWLFGGDGRAEGHRGSDSPSLPPSLCNKCYHLISSQKEQLQRVV